MSEASVIDLSDKLNPPPDDEEKAPHGWRWDGKEWSPRKRSPGAGRKSGSSWWAGDDKPDPEPVLIQEEGKDPPPAHMAAKKLPKTPPRVSKKTKDEITGAVGMIGVFILPPIVARDPFCGEALTGQFPQIADAVVPLLCKSHTVVGYFSDTSTDWMLWVKLAMAFAPVGVAVSQHHILKTVEIQQDTETGDMYAVKKDFSEYEVPADA